MKIYNVFACGFDIEHGTPSFDLLATVNNIDIAKTKINELLKGSYVNSESYIHPSISTTNDYTYVGRRADCLMEINNGGFAGFIIEPNEINVFDDVIINNIVNPEIVDDESFDEDGEEYADLENHSVCNTTTEGTLPKRNTTDSNTIKCFTFNFSFDKEFKIGIIPFIKEPKYDHEYAEDDYYDKMLEECSNRDLEVKYGVHDVSGQIVEYNGVTYDGRYGFDTYEVAEDRIDSLMQEWKDILNSLGFTTGDIIYKVEGRDAHTS